VSREATYACNAEVEDEISTAVADDGMYTFVDDPDATYASDRPLPRNCSTQTSRSSSTYTESRSWKS
jgi:hypothetical protein